MKAAQAYFGTRAEAYRQSPAHANAVELQRMVALLSPATGALALDLATGGGHTARALAEAGCRVVTTDVTREMEPHLLADAQRMPLRAGSFNLVASRIAPHHFEDLDAFVSEASRVLRPGGALYVFDLTTPEDEAAARTIDRIERLRDPSHVSSWPLSRWRAALEAAHLEIERLDARHSDLPLEPWLARARMPPEREAEARRLLDEGRGKLGGYGLTDAGAMRVLRVEMVGRRRE